MNEWKEFNKRNKPGKPNIKWQKQFRGGYIKHLNITSKDLLVGIAMQKAKILALGMDLYWDEAKKVG